MIYINPKHNFEQEWIKNGKFLWANETETLMKIQVDNSLSLGWKPEDILVVMNFPWRYRGIKSIVVGDENYCDFAPTASKINVICDMFDKGMIGDDLYWFHDNDAFQLDRQDVDVGDEVALTDYGFAMGGDPEVSKRWSTGVLFFRKGSKQMFELLKHGVNNSYKKNEETALLAMVRCNYGGIKNMIRKINVTYNFATRNRHIPEQYEMADKPLRTIHFHPFDPRPLKGWKNNMEAVQEYVTDDFKKILTKHI